MLELLNKIPENVGWVIVGVLGALCAMLLWKLGATVVEMIQERLEEEEIEE